MIDRFRLSDRFLTRRRHILLSTLFALATLALFATTTATRAAEEADSKNSSEGEWIQLFNGKDLSGWTPKIRGYEVGDNFANTFRVEDGVMKVSYDGYDKFNNRFGHLFYNHPYSRYKFRVEYRFVGDQCPGGEGWAFKNSGVMIHGQEPKTMGKDQSFPVSIEVQLLGGKGMGTRTTGNLCTPGTHVVMDGKLLTQHCFNSKSETYNGDEWVTLEIDVDGDKVITHKINGEQVLQYEKPQYDPKDKDAEKLIPADGDLRLSGGTISLQSESHPIEFRKVEILPAGDQK